MLYDNDVGRSLHYMWFQVAHNQNSQGVRPGDLRGHSCIKVRFGTRVSPYACPVVTGASMCGGTPFCMNVMEWNACLSYKWGKTILKIGQLSQKLFETYRLKFPGRKKDESVTKGTVGQHHSVTFSSWGCFFHQYMLVFFCPYATVLCVNTST